MSRKKYFTKEERKESRKAYHQAYYLANREQRKVSAHARYVALTEEEREVKRVYGRAWHKVNREKILISIKKRRARNNASIEGYLVDKGCIVCGESRRFCLDFHHVDPSAKWDSISNLVSQDSSIAKLEAEVAKCVVFCANCHRGYHVGDIEICNLVEGVCL